jgi:hypothetical protein
VALSAEEKRALDESMRGLVDPHGILREGALEEPDRARALMVFAQREDARVDLVMWKRHAEDFFDARLALNVAKDYPEGYPRVDAVGVVLSPRGGPPEAQRLCYGRPRRDDDLRAAEDADSLAGNTGLGLLAKRCASVWLVVMEETADRTALLLAAILASVVLGPILSPEGALFGVKTARGKLETMAGPYR